MLQFMKDLGPNDTLDPWKLAAKCLILTMLTTMCRLHEAVDIKISQMFPSVGGMRIMLNKPTKTFNMSTSRSAPGLQMLDLSRFENDELLCPVSTLDAYLDKTRSLRGSIDDMYIVLTGSIRPASPHTLAGWIRKFMTEAGLGGFTIHSTRSASSTAGLLAGIPIDELISRVGWKHPSTFINYYLKLLPQFRKHFKNNGTTFCSSTRSHYMPALPSTLNETLVSDFQDIWKGNRVT